MIWFLSLHLTLLLVWLSYSKLEGVIQAYYYNGSDVESQPNIHALFTIQRSIVAVALMLFVEGWYIYVPVTMLTFSFIHNGFYCCKRNDLNPLVYPDRWKAESKTSRAIFDFSYKSRLVQFIVGIAIYATSLILYICMHGVEFQI
jgi:hypothetical protein